MGDTTEINAKVLSGELFLGVVAQHISIQKNYYMCEIGPFPKCGHMVSK